MPLKKNLVSHLSLLQPLLFLSLMSAICGAVDVQRVAGYSGEEAPGNRVIVGELAEFTINLDGRTYGNSCLQGPLSLDVDSGARVIDVIQGTPGIICPRNYDPVTGAEGAVGPLTNGTWTIRDAYGNSLSFEVLVDDGLNGDLDGDGSLDVDDVDLLTIGIATSDEDPRFDLNQDGQTDQLDLHTWVVDLAGTWFGDANVDGLFDSVDLVRVFQTGKYDTESVAAWSEGDWNADGLFDSADLVSAFQDGGYDAGSRPASQAVPEPLGWSLLIGFLALLKRRPSPVAV